MSKSSSSSPPLHEESVNDVIFGQKKSDHRCNGNRSENIYFMLLQKAQNRMSLQSSFYHKTVLFALVLFFILFFRMVIL